MGYEMKLKFYILLNSDTYILGASFGGGGNFFLASGISGVTSINFLSFFTPLYSDYKKYIKIISLSKIQTKFSLK
jgi:hypothetical protein